VLGARGCRGATRPLADENDGEQMPMWGRTEQVPKGLRIAINTLSVTADKGGIKTYLTNLVQSLVESQPHHHYELLCSPLNKALFRPAIENGRSVSVVCLPLRKSGATLHHKRNGRALVFGNYLRDSRLVRADPCFRTLDTSFRYSWCNGTIHFCRQA